MNAVPHPLPSGWSWVTLLEVAGPMKNSVVDGPFGSSLKLSDYVPTGVPVLQGKNITGDRFVWSDIRFIPESKANELNRSAVRVGDILIVKIGSIGYSAILNDLHGYDRAVIPANLAKVTPWHARVDTRYLHRWLTSPTAKRMLSERASSTAQPALSLEKIKVLPVPLPPLPYQRHIATILDKADGIRLERQQALKLTDDLLRSAFLDMFGDPVRNPKGWPTVALRDLCRIRRGASPRPISQYLGGTVPWIKIGDICLDDPTYITSTAEYVTEAGAAKSVLLGPGALIFSNSGSLGLARILKIHGCIHDGWLSIDELDPSIDQVFLLTLLNLSTDHFLRIAPQGTQKNLNTSIMGSFAIILPPKTLQERYVQLVNVGRELRAKALAAHAAQEVLFGSLVQRAFRGDL